MRPNGTRLFVGDLTSCLDQISRLAYYGACLLIAQLVFRPFHHVTASDFLFFVSLVGGSVSTAISGRIKRSLPVLIILGVLFLSVGGVLSGYLSGNISSTINVLARLLYLALVWCWLPTAIFHQSSHLKKAILCWLISCAVTAIAASIQLFDPSLIPAYGSQWGRTAGFTMHPNDLGAICATALPAAWIMFHHRRDIAANSWLCGGLVLLIGAGLMLSGSVGSLLATCVALSAWFILWGKTQRGVKGIVLIVMLAASASGIQSMLHGRSPLERFEVVTNPSYGNEATLFSRIDTYEVAAQRVASDPLLGVGMTPGGTKTSTGFAVHNSLLGSLYESGILGLFGWILIALSPFYCGYFIQRIKYLSEIQILNRALMLAWLAFITYTMSAPVLYNRYGWIAAALLFSSVSLNRQWRIQPSRQF